MAFKISIIGPTHLEKLSRLTNRPLSFFLAKSRMLGKIIAESEAELWANADKGMVHQVALAYKESGGRKLVILFPKESSPWPIDHAKPFRDYADELKEEANWFWTNYNLVSQPDICLCTGLSSGTLSELSYIKWDHLFKKGRLKKLVAIEELLRGGHLPLEIEVDIPEKLIYLKRVEQLSGYLSRLKKEIFQKT